MRTMTLFHDFAICIRSSHVGGIVDRGWRWKCSHNRCSSKVFIMNSSVRFSLSSRCNASCSSVSKEIRLSFNPSYLSSWGLVSLFSTTLPHEVIWFIDCGDNVCHCMCCKSVTLARFRRKNVRGRRRRIIWEHRWLDRRIYSWAFRMRRGVLPCARKCLGGFALLDIKLYFLWRFLSIW